MEDLCKQELEEYDFFNEEDFWVYLQDVTT